MNDPQEKSEKPMKKGCAPKCVIFLLVLALLAFGFLYVKHLYTESWSSDELQEAIRNEFSLILNNDVDNPFKQALQEGFTCEIKEINVKNKQKTQVICEFSNYDVAKAFQEIEEQEMLFSDFVTQLSEILKHQSRISAEISLDVSKNETGEIKVIYDDNALDIALGGFLSYVSAQEKK